MAFANRTNQDKNQSLNETVSSKTQKENNFVGFTDNRQEVHVQRDFQKVANAGLAARQIAQLQEIAAPKTNKAAIKVEITQDKITDVVSGKDHGVVQRALVRVRAAEGDDNLIGTVKISADRFPTNVSRGQGDHTVSNALFNLAVTSQLEGTAFADAGQKLVRLLGEVPPETTARYQSDGIGYEDITADTVLAEIAKYNTMAASGAPIHKLISVLEDCIEHITRLWNKRQNAAHSRSEHVTSGGGNEGLSVDLLEFWRERDGDNATYDGENLEAIATAINGLIDYTGDDDDEEVQHVVDAVDLAALALPAIANDVDEITDIIFRIRAE